MHNYRLIMRGEDDLLVVFLITMGATHVVVESFGVGTVRLRCYMEPEKMRDLLMADRERKRRGFEGYFIGVTEAPLTTIDDLHGDYAYEVVYLDVDANDEDFHPMATMALFRTRMGVQNQAVC
jgi:hypothetical protein